MAEGDVYVESAALRSALRIGGAEEDTEADRAVTAASRAIDEACGRFFYQAGPEPRLYRPDPGLCTVAVDDFHTTAGLTVEVDTAGDGTYATAWDATDWLAEPVNPRYRWPFESIAAAGTRLFPRQPGRRPAVRVTASWGWAAVPVEIEQAALLLAMKLFRRRDTPLGIVTTTEFAAVRVARSDPDVSSLIDPFVRDPVAVG